MLVGDHVNRIALAAFRRTLGPQARGAGNVAEAARSGPTPVRPDSRRVRIVEHKRRQRGQTFLDHLIIDVRAGKGGDGSVAFHREKFVPNGPPSGGNGGQGGSVYLRCDSNVGSLSGIPKQIRAAKGANGLGSWRHGKNAVDTVVPIPVGTVVREVLDERRAKTKDEVEQETLRGLSREEKEKRARDLRWVHYPLHSESNEESSWFQEAEENLLREERAEERARIRQDQHGEDPLYLDITEAHPDGSQGVLVAAGGAGGFGNPHFMTLANRSPKWATRGKEGTWITLELELKLLADIGLVGFPNAGKSTILRALTRSQAEVAPYAFTTLNPQIGTVRVFEGGVFRGELGDVVEDSAVQRAKARDALESGGISLDASGRTAGVGRSGAEIARFTIADNPGLIARASEDVGLGHSFLRSIERSLALVYVVDLSGEAPWDELRILRDELEAYKPGLSSKARMVVANKADLLDDADSEAVEAARAKLKKLKSFVKEELDRGMAARGVGVDVEVVAISGKYKINLEIAVRKMAGYVTEEKDRIRMQSNSDEHVLGRHD